MALNPEAKERFDKIDTVQADMYGLLREYVKNFDAHCQESAVCRATTNMELVNLKKAQEEHVAEVKNRVVERRSTRVALWVVVLGALLAALFASVRVSFHV